LLVEIPYPIPRPPLPHLCWLQVATVMAQIGVLSSVFGGPTPKPKLKPQFVSLPLQPATNRGEGKGGRGMGKGISTNNFISL
jgi:hypothetical protein